MYFLLGTRTMGTSSHASIIDSESKDANTFKKKSKKVTT